MSASPRALITGITGQDGSYLAELLLEQGYEVHGLVRAATADGVGNVAHLRERLSLHPGDLLDRSSLVKVLREAQPVEIYNLAAFSSVSASWTEPELAGELSGLGVTRLLEAIRECCPEARFFQASSSEMFGRVEESPQSERTPFHPRSPYGAAKLYAHWLTIGYRESHGLHASTGILFNHESPRRRLEFVTRKITWHAAAIRAGKVDKLQLGNVDARRDWGYAGDYARAMWLMLQQEHGDDYVLATGVTHSVRECVEIAFDQAGVDVESHVEIDDSLTRPADPQQLVGDPSKARERLSWEPETSFDALIRLMTDSDYELLTGGR